MKKNLYFKLYYHIEIPKKALLQKISQLRLERRQAAAIIQSIENNANMNDNPAYDTPHGNGINAENEVTPVVNRRQLILNTIEDLKRSLEDQSIELCGLNEDED